MPVRRESIGKQIKKILQGRTLDPATAMLYTTATQLNRRYKKVTLFGLFVSDENTFLVRPHLFSSKKVARNAEEWNKWFQENYGKILRDPILPGMENRTGGKQWRLYRVIGWVPNDSAGLINSAPRKKRNKTKQAGR